MFARFKKALVICAIPAIFFLSNANAFADSFIPVANQNASPTMTPPPPFINAKAYILLDANSGKVLAEKNADTRMAPASLTKIMTLYLASNAVKNGTIHLDDKVRISTKAWKTGGSRMFVKVGNNVTVKDLLKGIAVASGNDASVAIAEYIAGSEEAFAALMNEQAKAIGMNNTHFTDSTGLPNPNHYTTARDLSILARTLTTQFPEDYQLFSEKWFSYNGIKQPNRNRLLWRYQYADGLKTGHTEEAGFCLVASAVKDKMRLISVMMGSPSDEARTEDSIRLLTYGYRFFETHKILNANSVVASGRIWKGKTKEAKFGVTEDWFATVPNGQFKNITTEISLNGPLYAPLTKGQTYGSVNLVYKGQVIATKPVIAFENVKKGGVFRRLADSVSFRFHKSFPKPNDTLNNS